jgi:hypothetical protein
VYDAGMNALRDVVRRTGLCVFIAAAVLFALRVALAQSAASPRPATLHLLDGTTADARSLSLSAGKLAGDGVPEGLMLDDLMRIELASEQPAAMKLPVVAELRGGGRIGGKSVTIGEDKCRIEWPLGDALAMPIDVVRALRLAPEAATPEFDKALATPAADADRIFFKVDGKSDSISGLIVSLTADQLTFQLDGAERVLPRAQLVGLVLAQPQVEAEVTRTTVHLQGGSRLAGDLTAIANGAATLALPGGGEIKFPWSAALSVDVRSSRVAYLSDLKPLEVEESTLLTLPRPWQRDKNVMGKPLTLGSRVFDKGLGVHARSALTFAADRKYDVLSAVIGIDAQSGGKGDCVFSVLGDGQSVFAQRIKGNDPPQDLKVDVSRYERITLLVEPGEGLDLGDHANWCNVRLVRNK